MTSDTNTVCLLGTGFVATNLQQYTEKQALNYKFVGINRKNFHQTPNLVENAKFIISSIPPENEADPVLTHYQTAIENCPAKRVIYLSSTGVYGDAHGNWVDEASDCEANSRFKAEQAWHKLSKPVTILRLSGIYGNGRGMINRVQEDAVEQRIDAPESIMNRIHVIDIVRVLCAFLQNSSIADGIYNLADDYPCTSREMIDTACRYYKKPLPPLVALEKANLSDRAKQFYTENKKVDNRKVKRATGLLWQYPSFKQVL